jgi:DNA-binding NtrC family response regulator
VYVGLLVEFNRSEAGTLEIAVEQTAIVVDDKENSRKPIARDLEGVGFRVIETGDAREGWRVFQRSSPDLVMSAAGLPGSGGIDLLRRIRRVSDVPVILFSEAGDVRTAVSAFRSGAQDFLTFPADRDRLIANAIALSRDVVSGPPRSVLPRSIQPKWEIVGVSALAQRLRDRVRALASIRVPVLVSGESGSGRDHVVRCLDGLASGAGTELAKVSTGSPIALHRPPPDAAVFLDEIGRFTLAEQAHWFDVLCREAGGTRGRCARIYASTSDDLDRSVREGKFHPGLAERLRRFEVPIPPLRVRREDIGPIAVRLAARVGRSMGRPRIRFERCASALLRAEPWVGNVRELATVVEKLVAFSPEGNVTRSHVRETLGEVPDSVSWLRQRREEEQRDELVGLLEACGGNLAEVARRLDISRGAVIYRAQKYGLLPKSGCGRATRRKGFA